MVQIITRLQLQKRNKERVNVFLDEEYAFSLSLRIAETLRKGQELAATDIEALQIKDEVDRAYSLALRYLGYRPRSQGETMQHLRKKGYSSNACEATIDRLLRNNYLNDGDFVRFWVENRAQFRPQSARALRYELRQKGIDSELIDEALADLDEVDAAWDALESKLSRWAELEQAEFEKKAMSFLSRRGFGYAIAREACARAWTYCQTE